ncbi:hypothetical protein TNCV_4675801 [Trichonephila clavipes]|nr:hypothetical protein TNCV_4675801 [Trichonephila clavipes]
MRRALKLKDRQQQQTGVPELFLSTNYDGRQTCADNVVANGNFFTLKPIHIQKNWVQLSLSLEDDDGTNVDSEKEFSLEQKLELAITKKISTNQNSMQKPATSKTIRQGIDLFEDEEFRGKYLEKAMLRIANCTPN